MALLMLLYTPPQYPSANQRQVCSCWTNGYAATVDDLVAAQSRQIPKQATGLN